MEAARKLVERRPELEAGSVERTTGGLAVRLASGVQGARRAKSCLVLPEPGDRVLCAIEPDRVYVLAVLEGRAATRVSAEGDLTVDVPCGRLALRSAEGLDLLGARDVRLAADELEVSARRGTVLVGELGFVGRLLEAQAKKVSLVAHEVDAAVGSLFQRAKRAFRIVEEIDQLRAGTVDIRAERLAAVRAETTVIAARVLAKIDAEQVHIG